MYTFCKIREHIQWKLFKYSKCRTCNYMLITNLVSCIVFLRVSPPSSNFKNLLSFHFRPHSSPWQSMCSSQTSSHSFSHMGSKQEHLVPWSADAHTQRTLLNLGDWSWGTGLEWRLLNEAQPFWDLRVMLFSHIPDSLLIYSVNCILSSRLCPLFRSEILICFVTDLSPVARLMLITL